MQFKYTALDVQPTRDVQDVPGDVAGLFAGEVEDRGGDVGDLAQALQGDAGGEVGVGFLGEAGGHGGLDQAGGDHVDGDAAAAQLAGQGLAEADQAGLGGGV